MHGSDRDARELRSVAPLLVDGKLIGPITVVHDGNKTIGATDAELLRPHVGARLAVAIALDGSELIPIGNWGLSRHSQLGLCDLVAPVPVGREVRPLGLDAVCASVDIRGTHTVLVGMVRSGDGFERTWIPVQLDTGEDGGMGEPPARLASPVLAEHVGMAVQGAALFAWFPANPALGRASEVLVLGLAQAYRGFEKPREHPVIAEIVGLDDLGRALLTSHKVEEREPELVQVAGEIDAHDVARALGHGKDRRG
ncbi:MAG TPA: hypothetical protein VFT22_43290 [Kofleriaceae bacterium]|nr:hypothetical protein [Kofleriaceae bacterium]